MFLPRIITTQIAGWSFLRMDKVHEEYLTCNKALGSPCKHCSMDLISTLYSGFSAIYFYNPFCKYTLWNYCSKRKVTVPDENNLTHSSQRCPRLVNIQVLALYFLDTQFSICTWLCSPPFILMDHFYWVSTYFLVLLDLYAVFTSINQDTVIEAPPVFLCMMSIKIRWSFDQFSIARSWFF